VNFSDSNEGASQVSDIVVPENAGEGHANTDYGILRQGKEGSLKVSLEELRAVEGFTAHKSVELPSLVSF